MSIAVIGLGNILLKDEGIGVHTVNKIKNEYQFSSDIEIIDGGTLGLDLLPYFEKHSKVLIIDAADLKKEPGYIKIFDSDEILKSFYKKLSVHHIGIPDILTACELMNIKSDEIKIIGIQPCSTDFGTEMSYEIQSKMELIFQLILEQLQKWSVKCVSLSHQKS